MFKQLQDMALFALVAECGSFTAAAQRTGLPKSSVSQRVSQLNQTVLQSDSGGWISFRTAEGGHR